MTEGLGGKRKVRANGEKGRITVINQKLKILKREVQKKINNVKKKEILRIAAGMLTKQGALWTACREEKSKRKFLRELLRRPKPVLIQKQRKGK